MPHLLRFSLVLLLATTLTGCFYSREMSRVKRDLERQYPEARFEREVVVNLGPVSMRTLAWLANRVPEDEADEAAGYLRDVRRVKVGVYRTDRLPPLDQIRLPAAERLEREGWQVAVKVVEDDEAVWVLYREGARTVRDLYVMALSDDALVVTRLRGRLDRILERALAEHYRPEEMLGMDW